LIELNFNDSSFSVVLKSREDLYGLVLNGVRGKGLILNGSLGEIIDVEFLDDSVMVIKGRKGVIRIDLPRKYFFMDRKLFTATDMDFLDEPKGKS
jgi:hypothetical protein